MGNAKELPARGGNKKGLIIVNTGHGKGKTTAALGVLFRAWGYGMKVGVLQFMKAETGTWGEVRAARKLELDWHTSGDGFTWTSRDLDESASRARHGWDKAQAMITKGGYDIVILDEFTYPLTFGWLDTDEVVLWLEENKPKKLHLIITGRDAVPALVELADLVTEMKIIKHPLEDQGIRAQRGIEY